MTIKKIFTVVLFLLITLTLYAQSVPHVVKRGETLKSIAKLYNLPEKAILEENPGVHSRALIVGSTLKIPLSSYSEKKSAPLENKSPKKEEPQSSSPSANLGSLSASASSYQKETDKDVNSFFNFNHNYSTGLYYQIAYAHPLLKKTTRDLYDSNWGLKFGVGVDYFPTNIPLFISFGNEFNLNWSKLKGANKTVCGMENIFPLQLGFGKKGMNMRAGGALGYFMSFDGNSKPIFIYGLKFNISFVVDIGCELLWMKGFDEPSKLLTIGFRF